MDGQLIRAAVPNDIDFIAQCFINIADFMKANGSDIYIDGLPGVVDNATVELAASYVGNPAAIALIVDHDGQAVGCMAADIATTSFPPSGIGRVGNLGICWIHEQHRSKHLASTLLQTVEKWFADKHIDVIELSYMAQNSLAAEIWEKVGYTPFRVFSHKVLKL